MSSMDDLAKTLDSISRPTFHGDEKSRMRVANAARKLADRIEEPWEKMYNLALIQPLQMVTIKASTDMKLWSHLGSTPQTSAQLAKKTGADRDFLRRMLRILVVLGIVEETGIDSFVATDMSKALAKPDGLINGLDMYYEFGLPQMQRVPKYFKENGYRIPEDMTHAPVKWVMGKPDHQGGFWQMIDEMNFTPKFNSFLGGVRIGQPSWAPLWPVREKLLDGWDGKSVLLVDVGGGKGRDISNLAEQIHETHPNARLVLQDRPSVLEEAKISGLHPQVETMPHDFFKPNPVHGARAYFEHAVIHDWPDKEGREILKQMMAGMTPGYSKILLMEIVMPESCKEVDTKLACMDLQMALNFCALERTEEQWKALLESVGLKYVGYQVLFGRTCMIEAEL